MERGALPTALAELVEWFAARGFQVRSDQRGGMGGRNLTLRGEVQASNGSVSTDININGDRGRWSIGVSFDGMSRWTTAMVWKAVLDDVPVAELPLDEDVAFLRERVVDMAHAYLADRGVEHKIVRLGERYMRERYDI